MRHEPLGRAASLPEPEALGFGNHLGPFVVIAEHRDEHGWSAPEVLPRRAARMDVATGALQYGVSVFDGLKAYRAPDGKPLLFRVSDHARRLQASARRLAMPEPSEDLLLQMMVRAVEVHRDWLPPHRRGSLYLRPTLYACEEVLGLRRAGRHALSIVVTPCSDPGLKPKRLWAERDFIRAAPGGLGAAKTGANYAASLYGAQLARSRGYDDAMWLDAPQRRYLSEAGTMNVFVVLRDRVLTPMLDGTILAGITRESVMQLLRAEGIEVEECPISLEDLAVWQETGELREIFGTGTAARVSPISEIAWDGGAVRPAGGDITLRMSKRLAELQNGVEKDRFGWATRIDAWDGSARARSGASSLLQSRLL